MACHCHINAYTCMHELFAYTCKRRTLAFCALIQSTDPDFCATCAGAAAAAAAAATAKAPSTPPAPSPSSSWSQVASHQAPNAASAAKNASAHEKKLALLDKSVEGLAKAVSHFEGSHGELSAKVDDKLAKLRDEVSALAKEMAKTSESVQSIVSCQALQIEAMQQQQRDQNPQQVGSSTTQLQQQQQQGLKGGKKKKGDKGKDSSSSSPAGIDLEFDLLDKPVSLKQHNEDCRAIQDALRKEMGELRKMVDSSTTLGLKGMEKLKRFDDKLKAFDERVDGLQTNFALSVERAARCASLHEENSHLMVTMADHIQQEMGSLRVRVDEVETHSRSFMESAVARIDQCNRIYQKPTGSPPSASAGSAEGPPESATVQNVCGQIENMRRRIDKLVLKLGAVLHWTQHASKCMHDTNSHVKGSLYTLTFRVNVVTMSILQNPELCTKTLLPEIQAQLDSVKRFTEAICDETSGIMCNKVKKFLEQATEDLKGVDLANVDADYDVHE